MDDATNDADDADEAVGGAGGSFRPGALAGAIDTHCHLYLMDAEPQAAVRQAQDAGVATLVCVGIDPETSARSLELAESFRGVFATAGMHPHTASGFDRAAGAAIEGLLDSPLVVGVGETGLDYYRRLSPVEDQQRAFRSHIALARAADRPLVVHVREAWDDALRILREERAERVVLHCFSGDERIALESAARGYFLSFAGNVTYPKAEMLRRASASVPVDRLLLETDSPFLPPQEHRGSPNTPSNVLAVAGSLARERNLNVHEMVERTSASAMTAFPFVR